MSESSTDQVTAEAEQARSAFSGDVENVKESFQHLRKDVIELLESAFGLGKTGASVAKEEASSAVSALKSRLEQLKANGSEKVAGLEGKISQNPVPAALIAFGVGFLVAKILARR